MRTSNLFACAVVLALVPAKDAPANEPISNATPQPQIERLTNAEKPGVGRISDVAWLTGCWSGKGFAGVVEEQYAPPSGGSMLATFRASQNGKPVLYEFIVLEEVAGSLILRVKHFSPDLVGWED